MQWQGKRLWAGGLQQIASPDQGSAAARRPIQSTDAAPEARHDTAEAAQAMRAHLRPPPLCRSTTARAEFFSSSYLQGSREGRGPSSLGLTGKYPQLLLQGPCGQLRKAWSPPSSPHTSLRHMGS